MPVSLRLAALLLLVLALVHFASVESSVTSTPSKSPIVRTRAPTGEMLACDSPKIDFRKKCLKRAPTCKWYGPQFKRNGGYCDYAGLTRRPTPRPTLKPTKQRACRTYKKKVPCNNQNGRCTFNAKRKVCVAAPKPASTKSPTTKVPTKAPTPLGILCDSFIGLRACCGQAHVNNNNNPCLNPAVRNGRCAWDKQNLLCLMPAVTS